MKPPVKFLEKLIDLYKDDTAKFLTHTASISWILASIANIVGISTNKKLDPKEKKFLVPQEVADGLVNIGLFYTVTRGLAKGVEKLFDSKFVTLENMEKVGKKFENVREGAAIIATVGGAILSRNILTPIIRGQYAAYKQKQTLRLEQENIIPGRSMTYFKQNLISPMPMSSFLAFTRKPGMKI